MKFLYEYRTADNARHDGVIFAPDREAAYSGLKARGVRPSRLVEAPGFVNKILGKGKRWMLIAILAMFAVVVTIMLYRASNDVIRANETFDSPMRRQIIGDPEVIAEGIRTGWASVFSLEGDRFLASFAVPGAIAAVRSSTEGEIEKSLNASIADLGSKNDSSVEARQIRAIVSGMKGELRAFLSDGGSIRQYCRLLVQRQEEELGYYQRAKNEIERAVRESRNDSDLSDLIRSINNSLRKMGIKPVVLSAEENFSKSY